MKKTLTPALFFIICSCGIFMSCSKDVKSPKKISKTSSATITNNNSGQQNTNNQNQGDGHTCGNSGSANHGSDGF